MKTNSRRNLFRRGLYSMILAGVALAGGAQAQGLPDKGRPMRIIVPAGAATAADLYARNYAKAVGEITGLNAIVENKPGAEMLIGVQAFLMSPPDGYTVMLTSSSSQTLNPVMIPSLRYDPLKDMIPITGVSKAGFFMNLGPSTTFKTAREFISAARAEPGKYTCASSTTSTRLACNLLEATANIKLLNVPYKTTAAALTAVSAGEADLILVEGGSARPHWQTGRLRGVAVTTSTRMPALPQLPTLREEGVQDYEFVVWYAIYAPAGTPPDVVEFLRNAFHKASATKEIMETVSKFTHEPFGVTPDELVDLNRREIERWSQFVRTHDIKPGS
ncbi:tripartite tricarboxylate transporter substrate binding protein [Achromobacter xylosoxidans]|nr:tripartite tricarboxylate transporter substrate binding protein [Achromobacter xylosoxidans]